MMMKMLHTASHRTLAWLAADTLVPAPSRADPDKSPTRESLLLLVLSCCCCWTAPACVGRRILVALPWMLLTLMLTPLLLVSSSMWWTTMTTNPTTMPVETLPPTLGCSTGTPPNGRPSARVACVSVESRAVLRACGGYCCCCRAMISMMVSNANCRCGSRCSVDVAVVARVGSEGWTSTVETCRTSIESPRYEDCIARQNEAAGTFVVCGCRLLPFQIFRHPRFPCYCSPPPTRQGTRSWL
mmetsp:Transcript_12117/g.29434  ORF Transcript_12117/g.29434 Transcript_12117/m.29434 type:complete len:242 (-) Transcript_12117:26-751(-)